MKIKNMDNGFELSNEVSQLCELTFPIGRFRLKRTISGMKGLAKNQTITSKQMTSNGPFRNYIVICDYIIIKHDKGSVNSRDTEVNKLKNLVNIYKTHNVALDNKITKLWSENIEIFGLVKDSNKLQISEKYICQICKLRSPYEFDIPMNNSFASWLNILFSLKNFICQFWDYYIYWLQYDSTLNAVMHVEAIEDLKMDWIDQCKVIHNSSKLHFGFASIINAYESNNCISFELTDENNNTIDIINHKCIQSGVTNIIECLTYLNKAICRMNKLNRQYNDNWDYNDCILKRGIRITGFKRIWLFLLNGKINDEIVAIWEDIKTNARYGLELGMTKYKHILYNNNCSKLGKLVVLNFINNSFTEKDPKGNFDLLGKIYQKIDVFKYNSYINDKVEPVDEPGDERNKDFLDNISHISIINNDNELNDSNMDFGNLSTIKKPKLIRRKCETHILQQEGNLS